ncbi:MAG: hypothetical protein WD994_02645, partial [Pseudomonadales bacterium]
MIAEASDQTSQRHNRSPPETRFERRLIVADMDEFYFVSRLCLVKDEKYYDRFDQAFGSFFGGLDDWQGVFEEEHNRELLKDVVEALFPSRSEHELRQILSQYQHELIEAREAAEHETSDAAGDGQGEVWLSRLRERFRKVVWLN